MARKSQIEFKDQRFNKWIQNIKNIFSVDMDKDVAKVLDLLPAGYGHFKRNNKFPYDKVVESAIKHKISLDEIFNNLDAKSESDMSHVFKFIDSDLTIKVPFFLENKDGELFVFKQNSDIYMIKKDIDYSKSNINLLLKKNSVFYVKNVELKVDGNYILRNHSKNGKLEDTDNLYLTKDEFKKFETIGEVVSGYSFTSW